MIKRTHAVVLGILMVFILASGASAMSAASASEIKVYKTPYCGCCTSWSDVLEKDGFTTITEKRSDMDSVKDTLEVPLMLRSCHTAMVQGYVIEGHVPTADIKRLLRERPDIKGLAVPGMPIGSQGMEQGGRKDSYNVIGIRKDGSTFIYNSYPQ